MAMISSSSNSNPQWTHDVFISFRGEDVRKNFVAHLRAALSNAGINTFSDKKLEKGKEVEQKLFQAIEGSHISIVIFSKNYTESSWCLRELERIMQCQRTYQQVVLPIFYDVAASVVRDQTGYFGENLESTAKRRGGEGLENSLSSWRSALKQAGNLSGWSVSQSSDEDELIKQIVEDVSTKLDTSLLPITEFQVGLESRVEEKLDFIQNHSSKGCIIGIWGIGGSGKTTTAKAIYNRIQGKFANSSFIEKIREVCDKDDRGVVQLQNQLLSDILKTQKNIDNIEKGTIEIARIFQRKRILVVLDDVTTPAQLKALCGNPKFFGLGNVLIITTRNKRVLKSLDINVVYIVKKMAENESLELFSWHAFRQKSPLVDFIELSKKVVAYCGGLPLALEVIGSSLYDRTKQEWESSLSKLEQIPNNEVQEKLRLSYDGLEDDAEKDIFLDICCFFIGKDRAYVTEILNACGLYAVIGITDLIERSLLNVQKNNKLGMHDLIRDMGREIVRKSAAREPGKRSRLWLHDEVYDVLTKNTGTDSIEGLIWNLQNKGRVSFNTNAFKEMKRLRLLKLDSVDLVGDFGCVSKQLRWVNWKRCSFENECIPDDFYPENLVVFELKYSNIKQVWKETKLLEKLKILNLSHSLYLKNTPNFSKLPNLEKLIMKDCPSLSEVHPSIGDLKKIIEINLKDCKNLTSLPKKIYQLKTVTSLNLSGCTKIVELEDDIVQMESLKTLIAKDTGVKHVPHSIATLKNIGYISLCGYEGFSRDVFPSLISSWMSPNINSLQRNPPFWGMFPIHLQVHLGTQLNQQLRFLQQEHFIEWETTHASQISDLSLESLLIGVGSCDDVIDTLSNSISQALASNCSSDSFLPANNYPSWLAYTCEGPSVTFQVPEQDSDYCLEGITLCVVYSSTTENMETECLTSIKITNHTKNTYQIYKGETVMSFNDADWQGVKSNLDVGDKVEISVTFGHEMTVKETGVYLVYGQSMTLGIDPSTDEKMEPSAKKEVQPLLNDEKKEPSPKPYEIFVRFVRRLVECLLCLKEDEDKKC